MSIFVSAAIEIRSAAMAQFIFKKTTTTMKMKMMTKMMMTVNFSHDFRLDNRH